MQTNGKQGSGVGKHPQRLTGPQMASVFTCALSSKIRAEAKHALVFYDLDRLDGILDSLSVSFPAGTLHAVAMKANPVLGILKRIDQQGYGVEVASMGELELALAAGFGTDRIVFDSPVKTREELAFTLRRGIPINANSLHEVERIAKLKESMESKSPVGLRINPAVGMGSIPSTSVAMARSKFGVCLAERRREVMDAFSRYPWLTGLHVHIGSQGMSLDQLVNGIGIVYELWMQLREYREVRGFNIGGGLPAPYKKEDTRLSFSAYAEALRAACPALFDGSVQLTTEFGRAIHAGNGWAASRIEYVTEHEDGSATLLVHMGADLFLRKAYRPEDWHHDLSVCNEQGNLRSGNQRRYQVAGPLCFAGDYLAKEVLLPDDIQEGDYLLVHDAGAYTFSMWSLYNSRQFPAIVGYAGKGERFIQLKDRQTTAEIVRFWSSGTDRK